MSCFGKNIAVAKVQRAFPRTLCLKALVLETLGYETPFQGLCGMRGDEPRALPWAGMTDAFGVQPAKVRRSPQILVAFGRNVPGPVRVPRLRYTLSSMLRRSTLHVLLF